MDNHGKHTGNHPDRDHVSVLDEVIKDGFDGIYLDWSKDTRMRPSLLQGGQQALTRPRR